MINRKILPLLEKEMQSDKVIVLTGMRRVGKTTLARHLYDNVRARKLFLDLENPLNQEYFKVSDYDQIYQYLTKLAYGTGGELVIFLDEVQNLRNLPQVVKYLFDHYQIKFFLTGSASFYLKNLFTESLAGRKRIFELYPLDFEEFLSYKLPAFQKPTLSSRVEEPIFRYLVKYKDEYLTYGGFPSVVLKTTHEEKIAEIADIVTSYFQKEVNVLADFRKVSVLRELMFLLLTRVGNKIDVSKLSKELSVSRITIEEYLDFLEGTYFFSRIKPYSLSLDVSVRGQRKGYASDVGFLNYAGGITGACIFETAVYNLLRTQGATFFYQTKHGDEIDFILKQDGRLAAFEVKEMVHQQDVNRLRRMAYKIGINKYFLVSKKFVPLETVVYLFQL